MLQKGEDRNSGGTESYSSSILRAIMLPNDMKDIQHVSRSPWFLESLLRIRRTPNSGIKTRKETVSYFYLEGTKIVNKLSSSYCRSEIFDIEYFDYVYESTIIVKWNISETKLTMIPRIGNELIKLRHMCHTYPSSQDQDTYICNAPTMARDIRCQRMVNGRFIPSNTTLIIRNLYSLNTSDQINHARKRRWIADPYDLAEYHPDVQWENFKSMIPQLFACTGTTMGCSFCFVFLFYTTTNINPGVCMGACAVAVGGSCGSLFALGVQRILHQTVICTELHRQGFMPIEAYIADASYGRRMEKNHPEAVQMYRYLSQPVVTAMRASRGFTMLVSRMTMPWRRHMEFVEGLADEDDQIGRWIVLIALPLLKFFFYLKNLFRLIFAAIIIAVSLSYYLFRQRIKRSRSKRTC